MTAAFEAPPEEPRGGMTICWLRTAKHGEVTIEEAEARISALGERDFVALVRLGTRHHAHGLLDLAPSFTIVDPNAGRAAGAGPREMVAAQRLHEPFTPARRGKPIEERAAALAPARIVTLTPPPPKRRFARPPKPMMISEAQGVPRHFGDPAIRLAVWRIEMRALPRYLAGLKIERLGPPPESVDPGGFLRPEFAAEDATHANALYGARALAQLGALMAGAPA